MGRKNNHENEMEQIRQGLEAFLDKEIEGGDADEIPAETHRAGRGRAPKIAASQRAGDTPETGASRTKGNRDSRECREGYVGGRREGTSRNKPPGSGFSGNDCSGREPKAPGGKVSSGKASSGKGPKKPKNTEKPRKKKRRFLKFLLVAVLLVALAGAGLYQVVGAVYGKMNYKEVESMSALPMKEDGVVNILLIGNDSRKNSDDGRSDAMILLSVSGRTKTIYMTSLLRDIYVEIPGREGNRLNAAYSFGGPELLMETVEQNFDIPVHRYVSVNFEAFANLVDAVDGIDLELSTEEVEYVNAYLWEYNMLTGKPEGTDYMDTSVAGLVHLNGPQALAYSRNRYMGTDFGRTERQRKVLEAVIKKLPSALLSNAGEVMDGLLPNLTTNLTQNECFRLSLMAGKLLTYDIVSESIPRPGTYKNATIRKMAVLELDFEANIRYLKEKIYGE